MFFKKNTNLISSGKFGFPIRVGIDVEPFLQKQAFKKQQRRIGIGAFTADTYHIVTQ